MTMHHVMVVMVARPPAVNAAHREAADLANAIIAGQTRGMIQMRTWAQEWYGLALPDPLAMMSSGQSGSMPGGMSHSGQETTVGHGMPGGMMPGSQGIPQDMRGEMSMMADMWKLPPARLEAVFLSMMIPHDQSALNMAALVPRRAEHQELKDLAQAISHSQSNEIATMNARHSAWYGL
jgi:uncharacterized protein (DUF305 family)